MQADESRIFLFFYKLLLLFVLHSFTIKTIRLYKHYSMASNITPHLNSALWLQVFQHDNSF